MAEAGRERRRATPQLAVVLEAVRTSGTEHPTAEQIYDRVRRALPSISLGTVYRNLQRLVRDGMIGAARLGARSLHYDPTPTPHDHFVCRSCGRIEDMVLDLPAMGARAGHEVESHTLVLYGRCGGCREPA
jgi:Fur family peroxide stress response transcriptional regulator